jgi:WD40 repeat protein
LEGEEFVNLDDSEGYVVADSEDKDQQNAEIDDSGASHSITGRYEVVVDNGEDEEEEEDLRDDSVLVFDGHTDSVYSVALNPKFENIVATGGGDDAIFLWDINTGKPIHHLTGMISYYSFCSTNRFPFLSLSNISLFFLFFYFVSSFAFFSLEQATLTQ